MFSQPTNSRQSQFTTNQNYSGTFSGPIRPNMDLARTARNESMSKAAFGGDIRGYRGQSGRGVGAGGKGAELRAGLLADAEANKAYAQAQQDVLNMYGDQAAPQLEFQERDAGEQGWLRDLLLDRDDTRTRERMSAYKRAADTALSEYDRTMLNAQQKWENQATIMGALF